MLWLISRRPPKASCGHWWEFWEVATARMCDAVIKDMMLELIQDDAGIRAAPNWA